MSTENELAARRTVLKLTHELADLSKDIGERYRELRAELHVSPTDIVSLTLDHLPAEVRHELDDGIAPSLPFLVEGIYLALQLVGMSDAERKQTIADQAGPQLSLIASSAGPGSFPADVHRGMLEMVEQAKADPYHKSGPMKRLLMRMFKEAATVASTDTPALECQAVVRHMGPLTGSLSTTPEGTLRMLVPTHPEGPKGPTVLAECFFDYDDLVSVVMQRDVKLEAPSLIQRPS